MHVLVEKDKKTSPELKQRRVEHKNPRRRKKEEEEEIHPVAAHFMEMNHPVCSLRYMGIDKLPT